MLRTNHRLRIEGKPVIAVEHAGRYEGRLTRGINHHQPIIGRVDNGKTHIHHALGVDTRVVSLHLDHLYGLRFGSLRQIGLSAGEDNKQGTDAAKGDNLTVSCQNIVLRPGMGMKGFIK